MDKMKQTAGDNSSNIQIAGDCSIGITAADAIAISREVAQHEIDRYKQEALAVAEERFEKIAEKAVESILEKNPKLLSSFREPAIQVALYDTYKKYIESGDDELGDNLIILLIERLNEVERNTKQFLIDDARNILPKLSRANLAFLALYVFSQINIPFKCRKEYEELLAKLKKLTAEVAEITTLDIAYLKQSGCTMSIPMIQTSKSIAECLLDTYEYYFSKGITNDVLNNTILPKYPIHNIDDAKMLTLLDFPKEGNALLRFSSKKRVDDFFTENDYPEYQKFVEDVISAQPKPTLEEVKKFHIDLDSNWKEVFDLWEKPNVRSISIMPVGLYIGSIYLGKVIDVKIPQEIFYPQF